MPLTTLEPIKARDLGADAFVYGFPLLLMTATMRRSIAADGIGTNRICHLSGFADPAFRTIVAANADTLYSLAWLDLSDGPVMLELPEAGGRSYLMPLMGAWTEVFASLSPRTAGPGGGTYAIVGPGWSGSLPQGARQIDAPTNEVWAIYHLHAKGGADLEASRAIQRRLKLGPLGPSGNPLSQGVEIPALQPLPAAHEQVMQMDASSFLAELSARMAANPPAPVDAPLLERLATIRLRPGGRFEWSSLSPATREALAEGFEEGKERVASADFPAGANGWNAIRAGAGAFGADYLLRARTANFAFGVNRPEDAVFPFAGTDSEGRPLDGAHRYVLSFEAGGTPPVEAHWSLAMYDLDQLFVENPLGRYALGDRDELEIDADGALRILVQHDPPSGSQANWLPAPEGGFYLMLHLHLPDKRVLDGSWTVPPVKRID